MARIIIWSTRATADIAEIAAYISQDSIPYASAVVKTIIRKTRLLPSFPNAGRIVPELGDDSVREIFAYNYRIIYQIVDHEIRIAAIIHGRRILDISLEP